MKRSNNEPKQQPDDRSGEAAGDELLPAVRDTDADGAQATAANASQAPADAKGPATPQAGAAPVAANAAGAMERQLAEQHDKYLRLAAEYDNYRKRTVRERQEAAVRGQSDLLRGILDALDDLSRFAHVDPATTDPKTIVEGVALVERKMLKVLTGIGLEVVNPLDQTFDPSSMEAVATEPALSPEDDHVVAKVYQLGYRFNGQMLRPARVVVKQWNG